MKFHIHKSIVAAAVATSFASGAWAATTADEAKQLGTSLTWWGAEVAASKDGAIPAYTGGLKGQPAPKVDAKGYVTYPDPYAAETAASAAASRSASGSTTMWFLAPPSAWTRLPARVPVS